MYTYTIIMYVCIYLSVIKTKMKKLNIIKLNNTPN